MKSINPYINFPGNTEEAFAFYAGVFGTRHDGIIRYRDMGGTEMGLAGDDLDKVAHMALPLGGDKALMGTDVVGDQPPVSQGNNFFIMIEAESADEAQKLFDGLAAGGKTEMPLAKTEWAERYGICVDKFGIQWMVNYTGDVNFESPQG